MSSIVFMRLLVGLPVLVPMAAVGVAEFIPQAAPYATVLAFASLVGGIPYVVLAAISLWVLRHRDARAHLRVAWVAPIAFGTLLFLISLGITVAGASRDFDSILTAPLLYFASGLVLGYGYVLLARSLIWLAQRFDLVRPF